MDTNSIAERYGHMLKEERLIPLTSSVIPGTLAFNSPEPYPGFSQYYSDEPGHTRPLYVYLIFDEPVTLEKLIRSTQVVKERTAVKFDAAFVEITLNGQDYKGLRIRNLESYDHVETLQAAYYETGCFHSKLTRKDTEGNAIIRTRKFFSLHSPKQGLYFDNNDPEFGYFRIPDKISWIEFASLVKKVKFNYNLLQSDFGLGFFFWNHKIEDVIRVYNPQMSVEYLEEVRNQFLKWI